MTELETLRTFYRFNSRMRRKYLAAILRLRPEERLKDRGASYGSLQGIYAHTLDGLRWWLVAVAQDRPSDAAALSARDLSAEELLEETDRLDREVFRYLDRLTETGLSGEMVCHVTDEGETKEMRFPAGDVLWHEVEEELQHRGEMNALFWQMGMDPPIGRVEDWNAAKSESTYLR
jgi:uncharacterized damage-inducible protein DinB